MMNLRSVNGSEPSGRPSLGTAGTPAYAESGYNLQRFQPCDFIIQPIKTSVETSAINF